MRIWGPIIGILVAWTFYSYFGNSPPSSSSSSSFSQKLKGIRFWRSKAVVPLQGIYLDWGNVYGIAIWSTINWENDPYIDTNLATAYYLPLLQNVQAVGSDRVYLAFGQLYDVIALANKTGGFFTVTTSSPSDTIGQVFYPTTYYTNGTNLDFLAFFVALAQSFSPPIKVILSFGGAAAANGQTILDPATGKMVNSWTLPGTGQDSANAIVSFLNAYQLAGIDLDIEGLDFWNFNDQSQFSSFFSTLKANNVWISLSLLGAAAQDLNYTSLIPYANVVQLMLYSSAGGPDYVSSNWIQNFLNLPEVSNNPSLLAVGFDTDIDYTNSATCDPSNSECPTIPAGSSNGNAAYLTYQNALANVDPPLNPTQLQGTFWWMDAPLDFVETTSKEFITINDFWNALQNSTAV